VPFSRIPTGRSFHPPLSLPAVTFICAEQNVHALILAEQSSPDNTRAAFWEQLTSISRAGTPATTGTPAEMLYGLVRHDAATEVTGAL
jgi:hypothetical protein